MEAKTTKHGEERLPALKRRVAIPMLSRRVTRREAWQLAVPGVKTGQVLGVAAATPDQIRDTRAGYEITERFQYAQEP